LADGGVGREKGAADFGDAEAREGIQRESDLRFGGDNRVTAHELMRRRVVGNFAVERMVGRPRGFGAIDETDKFGFFITKNFLAPDDIEREVAGGAQYPRGGFFRNAVEGPGCRARARASCNDGLRRG